MVTDPISDMFNQIMNAQAVGKPVVWIPYSKIKFNLAKILKEHHYLREVKKRGLAARARLGLGLQYFDGQPAVSGFRRISKPGRRLYVEVKHIPFEKGLLILSTPQGLMEAREARKKHQGGEIIIQVW